jgi:hypothetical protein
MTEALLDIAAPARWRDQGAWAVPARRLMQPSSRFVHDSTDVGVESSGDARGASRVRRRDGRGVVHWIHRDVSGGRDPASWL